MIGTKIVNMFMPDIPMMLSNNKVISGYHPSPEPTDITLNLKCLPGDTINKYNEQGGLLQDLDLFKNISVAKMFQIINKKLKRREKSS